MVLSVLREKRFSFISMLLFCHLLSGASKKQSVIVSLQSKFQPCCTETSMSALHEFPTRHTCLYDSRERRFETRCKRVQVELGEKGRR